MRELYLEFCKPIKKKKKRKILKFLNVNARASLSVSVKNRNEVADYDYLDKLSPDELKWLKKFHTEYVQASFEHKKPLHKIKKYKKLCYDANNARNRDLYSFKKIRGMLFYGNKLGEL